MHGSTTPPTPDSVLSLAGSELARAVYRTANTLLASSPDAEEVTLDVLVSLRKKLRDVGQDGLEAWLPSLPGWLDRAAVGKAKGRAKKQKHHSSTLAELALLAEQVAANETKPMATAMLVREVLAYFPRRHRFVFVLKYGLGHTDADIAELAGLDPAVVARTLTSAAHELREYAAKQPIPKAMLEGMAPGLEDNPLRHYVEVFGRPDEVTEARIQRRFEAWLSDDPSDDPHSDDHSFHDHSFSGPGPSLESELDAEPEPERLLPERQRSVGIWVFGTVATLALAVLASMQHRASQQLERLGDAVADLEHGELATPAEEGPVLGAADVEVTASSCSLAAVVDPQQLQALATDEVYGRALALRTSDEAGAEALLREIVTRGSDDWVSELAFEQLRTLVDPDERLALSVAYAERFPDGEFAEAFAAIVCQAKGRQEEKSEAADCWSEFALTYPNSLYGP